ncbi:MAG: OPT/YSL family transporter, partial [Deltaproteobacteria bacterium]|nr:OPT/YSL family transporter [Deltaproteobacteria bacterium]
MAALPFTFTGDEALLAKADATTPDQSSADADQRRRSASGPVLVPRSAPAPRQLTVRALAVGLAIGAVLAAGNVYTGLKSSFIDGGAVTAALLSFTFFATFKRLARLPFSPFENNVAQTAAASAAVMGFVHGLMAPMPALTLMGHVTPAWALWTWGISLALVGVVIGAVLRRKLIVEDALPFPTGTATAELIRAVHADQGTAARRTRFLLAAALTAAVVTWFRDGRPALIPQALYLPLTVGGMTAASLTLGVATSPLMAATGMFIGLRGALSLFAGSVLAWGVVAPIAVRSGWTKDGGYGTLTSWLVWPALGMMLAATVIPPLLSWRAVSRMVINTVRDGHNLIARKNTGSGLVGHLPRRFGQLGHLQMGLVTVVLASGALAWTGWRAFGFSPYLTCAALVLSVVLSAVCARAAGETDIAPVGSVGTFTQIVFAGTGSGGSVLAGAVVSGNASEVAQTMWAFKTGHNLRASVRAQIVAQVLGAIVGSLVVVPAYLLIVRAYPLGSERMPAVSAVSWKATAMALTGGLSGLPTYGLHAAGAAFGVGAALCILSRTRAGKYLPSAIAMGIAMITPVSLSAAALIG